MDETGRPPKARPRAIVVLSALVLLALGVGVGTRHRWSAWFHPEERPNVPALVEAPQVEMRALPSGRTYLAVSSKHEEAASLPLVVVIHGDGGSAETVRAYTGFDNVLLSPPIARIAYLQAQGRYWGLSERKIRSELDYMRAVIVDAAAKDSSVFVFGWSSGAHLAQVLACEEPRVHAIALNGGRGSHLCARHIPTLIQHNEGDAAHGIALGDALAASIQAHHGCQPDSIPTLVPPCIAYQGCETPVAYCRVPGGTHRPWRNTATTAAAFFRQFQ